MIWRCRDRAFDLADRTLVMGIVNLTPDSFSDGGRHADPEAAVVHGRRLLDDGADLLDLGAESTRPGSAPVPADEQWRRLEGALRALLDHGACVSVDTASAEVAARAVAAGAHVVNDVTALRDPGMAAVVRDGGAGVVLMHMRGTPATMQQEPRYRDAARDIADWLRLRRDGAVRAGIEAERIALDPGIGFGKTARHSFELVARLEEVAAIGRPVLVGLSRKSFLGQLLDLPVHERLEAGLAATAVAVHLGARIVRTHDVRETVRAVRVAEALRRARRPAPIAGGLEA